MSERSAALALPGDLLERLTRSWQVACGCGKIPSFQQDVASLCEQYETCVVDSITVRKQTGKDSEKPIVSTATRSAGGARLDIQQLPDELLAAILRRTLDPGHPGHLCSSTYTRDVVHASALKGDMLYSAMSSFSSHFSCEVLCESSSIGPLPAILVCKRWHRLVLHGSVVSVLAVDFPSRLPPKLDTLMLRLDQTPDPNPDLVAAYRQRSLMCITGLERVSEVFCGSPCTPVHDSQRLGWPFAIFAPLLPGLPGLTKLDISHCPISSHVLHGPLRSLGDIPDLVSLTLRYSELGKSGIEVLAPCIGRLNKLTHLDLTGNSLGNLGLRHLSADITNLSSLRSLHLGDNGATDGGNDDDADGEATMRALISYVTGLRHLERLEACSTIISEGPLHEAVAGLAAMAHLRGVGLHTAGAGHKLASDLFSHLPAMTALEDLSLMSWSDPEDLEIRRQIRRPLTLAPTPLKSLFLCGPVWFALRDVDPRAHAFTALTRLSLERCDLTDADVQSLVLHLPGLSALRDLSLAGNYLHCTGMAVLAPHAWRLTALTRLDLSYNAISDRVSDPTSAALSHVLSPLVNLEILDLSYNLVSGQDLHTGLAQCLGNLCLLRELRLQGNPLGQLGALPLAPLLCCWTQLTRLGLSYGTGCGCQADRVCRSCMLLLAMLTPNEARLAALDTGFVNNRFDELRELWRLMRKMQRAYAPVAGGFVAR